MLRVAPTPVFALQQLGDELAQPIERCLRVDLGEPAEPRLSCPRALAGGPPVRCELELRSEILKADVEDRNGSVDLLESAIDERGLAHLGGTRQGQDAFRSLSRQHVDGLAQRDVAREEASLPLAQTDAQHMPCRPVRGHTARRAIEQWAGLRSADEEHRYRPVQEFTADVTIASRGRASKAHGSCHRVPARDALVEVAGEQALRAESKDRLHPNDHRAALLNASVGQAQDVAPAVARRHIDGQWIAGGARGLAPREHGQTQVRAKTQHFHEATCALVVSPSSLVLEDQPVWLGMADVVKEVISAALRADAPP